MKRYWCMLLMFTLCIVVVGCRRGLSTPRKPLEVAVEKDILPVPKGKAIIHSAKPKDRKYEIYLEDIYALPEGTRKKLLADAAGNQDKLEQSKDDGASKQIEAAKAKQGEREAYYEFEEFAKAALKYVEFRRTTPKMYSQEEFYKYVRREEFLFKKKTMDKVIGDVAIEDVYLTKYIDSGTMNYVCEVDYEPSVRNLYAIAHREGSGGGGGMMGGGAKSFMLVMFADPKKFDDGKGGKTGITSMSKQALDDQLQGQELRLLRTNYLAYAAPLHVRPFADAREAELTRKFLGYADYDAILARIRYGDPPSTLGGIDTFMPGLAKNPPEPRDIDKLKAHLKEKAPPSLLELLEDRHLAVNMLANLRNPNDIIACRTQPTIIVDPNDNQKKIVLGHRAITVSGSVDNTWVPANRVQWFLPKDPPKKKDMMGMPGM